MAKSCKFENIDCIALKSIQLPDKAKFIRFPLYYMPVKDGMYYGVTRSRQASGRHPHSLSGAYLQDYASYSYEILLVDRSHQGGVQCE